ncbi:hypothetical protein [Sporosarcina sp.]|uniref:hypothetical protein n=1 Tax=Sporosarcina sp. TaxID=49982 RepID=UPI002614D04F|nr:hypothetical protein [Sporosarcina sp.]
MTIVVISWAVNFAYAESKKLDQPIFVDHYIDVWWEEDPYFTIYYLANKEDRSTIQWVELEDWQGVPERNGMDVEFEEVDQFGRYSLRRVTLQMNGLPEITEAKEFREITAYFTEGPPVRAEIGQITVQPPYDTKQLFREHPHYDLNYKKTQLTTEEDITVESVTTSFDEVLQNQFFIKLYMRERSLDQRTLPEGMNVYEEKFWQDIPGIDARAVQFPFDMKKGERLTVTGTANVEMSSVLQMDIEVAGKTAENEPFAVRTEYRSEPQFTGQEIKQLIDKRTEAEANE